MTRSNESGFTLIEVLVSALLVSVACVGLFTELGALQQGSGRQRTSSQATAVVQQELEKWRSTSPSTLANIADGPDQTRDVTVGGRTYHLTTSIAWAQDQTGAPPTCSGSGPPSYLQVTTSVAWDDMGSRTAPTSSTIIAMPVGGIATLQAQVKDPSGNPLNLAHVTITGPTPTFGDTNVNGCVLFTNLDPGTYTVKATKAGWVDQTGNPNPTVTQQVTNGSSAIAAPITLGQASKFTFTFSTRIGGVTWPAQADRMMAAVGGSTFYFGTTRPAIGAGYVNPKQSLSTTIDTTTATAGLLYPFAGTWTISPGQCSASSGETNTSFDWNGTLAAGSTTSVPVILPYLSGGVFKFNGNFVSGIKVFFTRRSSTSCPSYALPYQTASASTGKVPIPGLLPGAYDICAQYTQTVSPFRTYKATDTNAFTLPIPSNLFDTTPPSDSYGTFNIGTGTQGTC